VPFLASFFEKLLNISRDLSVLPFLDSKIVSYAFIYPQMLANAPILFP